MSYIPHTDTDREAMLKAIGAQTMDELFSSVPRELRLTEMLDIPPRMDQISLTRHLSHVASQNLHADQAPCFLGAGVYDHYIPPIVWSMAGRSEFLTSYTPYQPEVSQGVLQSIFEFQTLLCRLLSMDVANASMYDGATALAEAALMAADLTGKKRLLASDSIHPHALHVLQTYCKPLGLDVQMLPSKKGRLDYPAAEAALEIDCAALLMQSPNFFGVLEDVAPLSELAHAHGALLVASVDPISLGLLKPPGECGVDIAVGEGQSLGCPMGWGGPLLGLFSCRSEYMRRLPGRIVGQTTAEGGERAYVMTLRTREQDIRRERATSNICTNEALYALAASVYLATMGKNGLRRIAELCLAGAHAAAAKIAEISGYGLMYPAVPFFQEFVITTPINAEALAEKLLERGIIGGLPLGSLYPDRSEMQNAMLICVTEQRTERDIDMLVAALVEIGEGK